jgi:hypothetical protein
MSQVPPKAMALAINKCFEAEGLPRRIKIDNGAPLVYPHHPDLPTLTVLWWIGLGIEVVLNKPRCPQQNGTVEGLQGICSRWANPAACADVRHLQQAVNEANRIQRRVYLLPKKKYQTRQQLYPQLETNPRTYDPRLFNFKRVAAFLSQQTWKRTVKKNGSIKFNGTEIYISQAYARQSLCLSYDPDENQWLIRDASGTLVKTSKKALIDQQAILNHVNMSKN